MSHRIRHFLLSTLVSGVLSGCAQSPPEVLSSGPTIQDIFARTTTQPKSTDYDYASRPISHGKLGLSPRARAALNTQGQYFKPLPNPTLCTYVFEHFAGHQPIPPYETCWQMYERTEWALPGEIYP